MIHRVLCSGLVIRVRVHSLERPLRIARLREFTCIFVRPLLSRLIVAYDLRPRGWTRDNLARKSRGNLWRSKTFRFAESRHRLRVAVSQSGVWLWFWKPVDTPNDRKISRVSFFLSKIFRFLGISEKPGETVGVEEKRGKNDGAV